jgi:hypothetical protein
MSEAMTAQELADAKIEVVLGISACVARLAQVRTFLSREQAMYLAGE